MKSRSDRPRRDHDHQCAAVAIVARPADQGQPTGCGGALSVWVIVTAQWMPLKQSLGVRNRTLQLQSLGSALAHPSNVHDVSLEAWPFVTRHCSRCIPLAHGPP